MQNSVYHPMQVSRLSSDSVMFAGKGVYGEANVVDPLIDNTVNIDLLLADDMLLTGGIFMVKGGHFEDRASMQILSSDLSILSEFVTDYRIIEDSIKQFELKNDYPAKILTGMTLRIKYTPCQIAGVRDISANYYLHKILC